MNVCSACGSRLGPQHDEVCLAWRGRRIDPWFRLAAFVFVNACLGYIVYLVWVGR